MKPCAALLLLAALQLLACGCTDSTATRAPAADRRVLVLGIDGMDPVLLRDLMERGRMPTFARLAERGAFRPLETSAPPQSPVAWSDFISGAGAGTHQIYDFIHRDPAPAEEAVTVMPFLSTSRAEPPARDWALSLLGWRVPLFGGETVLLRQGTPFWEHLVEQDIKTTIYRVPANYPPPVVEGAEDFFCLCGMGTPDILGSYGEFTLFTPNVIGGGRSVGGGRFAPLRLRRHRATGVLLGPENFLREPGADGGVPRMTLEFQAVRDPERDVVKISIDDELLVLRQGEWSQWTPIEFRTGVPGATVLGAMQLPTSLPAMVRFYIKQVHPRLEIYVTPLNIDPLAQANPIGTPASFPESLAESSGRYYTTGIPEDTKALRSGALTEDEFLSQVRLLESERLEQYRYALAAFDRGFLFFYFGHVDQLSHIFWRDRDPEHPAHDAEEARRYGQVIEETYVQMDLRLAEALESLDDDDTIIVMSDHGFTSFRHGFNLNTWLRENGYLVFHDGARPRDDVPLDGVDWSRTRAYAVGLNALYVNMRGREKAGIVDPEKRQELIEEISARLRAEKDALDRSPIDTVYDVDRYYPGADRKIAPDLLVGYADFYRGSWSTALGGTPDVVIEDNHDRWSGDHCIAHEIVPGILVTNLRVVVDDPALTDLAPTILDQLGVETPSAMTGRVLTRRGGPHE